MAITAQDVSQLKKVLATKDDLKAFATKDDLKAFATKDDLKVFAKKDDLKPFATKSDVADLKAYMVQNFATKDDLDVMSHDLTRAASDSFQSVPNRIEYQNHEHRLQALERKSQ